MCWSCIRGAAWERELLWALAVGGMLLFIMTDALSHEDMHYRHVWFAIALIGVQWKLSRIEQQQRVRSAVVATCPNGKAHFSFLF